MNRVLDIECREKLFIDARLVAEYAKKNYGHAGRAFVDRLQEEGFDKAAAIYRTFYDELSDVDTTEKQSMAAAIVMTGDALATEWIFKDGRALTVPEVRAFLQSKAAVNANARGYEYMCDWVTQNANKLKGSSEKDEVLGAFSDDGLRVYIISSVFRRAADEAGYNASALLSYMKQRGLIQTRGRNMTVGKRINRILTECVSMKLPQGFEDIDDDDPVPFE